MPKNHLLYKAEKLFVRLRHSVFSAWIDLGLGLCLAKASKK